MEALLLAAFGVVLGVWSWTTETRGRVALALLGCEFAFAVVLCAGALSFPLGAIGIFGLLVMSPIVPLHAGAAIHRRKDTVAAWVAFTVGAVFAGLLTALIVWPVFQMRA